MKVIVLAAGLGKRMKSKYPKVVHKLAGKELINWVLDTAKRLSNEIAVVLGHGADIVRKVVPDWVEIYIQKEQLGTAHAVMSAIDFIDEDDILILYGDVPLISENTLSRMIETHRKSGADVTVLTAFLEDPTGYGRIVRDKGGKFLKIVEEADASDDEKEIREINSGIYVFKGDKLREVLPKIRNDNAQGEYYLTDAISLLERVKTVSTDDPIEITGVNTRRQLVELERILRMRKIEELLDSGVTIIDPDTTYIHPDVAIGKDTVIHPMTFLEGRTIIGEDCVIGPMTRIKDSKIGNGVRIVRSEVEGAFIEDGVSIGPFSRIREGTVLKKSSKIGNFVETKKAIVGENSKAQHLTYLGDVFVGDDVNVGAGTITCNYDGKRKNPTFIEDRAFIGSNTALVAPVRIGKDSLIGAGSVITRDVPEGSLALGRARQVNKEGWVYRKKRP